ncbi:LysR family transcriptional regulator [Breznakiella homolactica]|uniref:LysR family transcriptional regulator n=1 Tax=Breznakiella homolactica TaxID=2798577 RepID=A0A7T7XKD9_9SPIR|nr:LysR family transcriptional regulator [Breznakiella homolactica]QQO07798.1 LysR family transcriptional regulator [Breznakiella homolactica]
MELRVLKYFLAVARDENISRAAEALHVTQPTLSRQLIELENELGAKLFIRGNRKLSLTDEGMLLRKRADEIIELVEKTEAQFQAADEIIGGDIYIGCGETDGMRFVADIMMELQRDYPEVRFHVFSGNAEDVTERLDKGLLDFGILIGAADRIKYESLRLPSQDTWGVLMRKDSPLACRSAITPKDLWKVPLITSRQAFTNNEITGWFRKDITKLSIVATYNLIFNASLMVEEGMGYALGLDKLINTTGKSPLCFKPLKPALKAGLYIVWKKYQVFSRAPAVFLDRLREALPDGN